MTTDNVAMDAIMTAPRQAPALHPPWERMHARLKAVLRKDLFFVVGCQKSGTTWLKHLLHAHPQIICRGEGRFQSVLLPLLQNTLGTYNKSHYAGHDLDFTDEQLEYLLTTCIGLFFSNALGDQNVKCLGEKTPENTIILPLLARLFPRAKFIQIVRDGRDAIASNWLRPHSEGFDERFPELASYVEYFVNHHWAPYIHIARSFGAEEPHRYAELRYEDLHAEPEPVIRRVLQFLDVDDSDAAVAQCRDEASFEKLSEGRGRGQEDRSSFYRKGVVGDWKDLFDEASIEAFARHGGAMARALGYVSSGPGFQQSKGNTTFFTPRGLKPEDLVPEGQATYKQD